MMNKGEYKTTADEIWDFIQTFSASYLDDELTDKSYKLVKCVQKNRCLNIFKGDVRIWAAAIIYVMARFNFLFDKDQSHHIAPALVGEYYAHSLKSILHKADKIEKECKIVLGDKRFSTAKIISEIKFFKTPSGFVIHNSFSDKCLKNISLINNNEARWLQNKMNERLRLEEDTLREKLIIRARKNRNQVKNQLDLFSNKK